MRQLESSLSIKETKMLDLTDKRELKETLMISMAFRGYDPLHVMLELDKLKILFE
jgi:hypothetical protein